MKPAWFPQMPAPGIQYYAVLDPWLEENRELIEAVGTDMLPLHSPRIVGHERLPYFFFRVQLSVLGDDQVVALCRLLARKHGWTEAGAFLEAVQGRGVAFRSGGCYVSDRPEIARKHFEDRHRNRPGRPGEGTP